jgi:hypothetical protein
MAKVTCHYCKEKIDKKDAIGLPYGKKTRYYCPNHVGKQPPKEAMYDLVYEIFGCKVLNTILYKEFDEIARIHTYEKMIIYLQDNKQYLEQVMNKEFSSEYAQIRYFASILKNNLTDFVVQQPKSVIKKVVEADLDISANKYKATKQRRGMDDLLNDLID